MEKRRKEKRRSGYGEADMERGEPKPVTNYK
jgi:hypothetical protein